MTWISFDERNLKLSKNMLNRVEVVTEREISPRV